MSGMGLDRGGAVRVACWSLVLLLLVVLLVAPVSGEKQCGGVCGAQEGVLRRA